jgi:histidinol-phosphate phosphatase family protein
MAVSPSNTTGAGTQSHDAAAKPAIFLDKDGTVLNNVPYNVEPERMSLAPTAADGLRVLGRSDYLLIVVSNQPGVALGYFDEGALLRVSEHLREMFEQCGARLADFRWCPHAPDVHGVPGCACRKPMPGLLTAAAADFGIDIGRSWMVGDILDDVEAGRRAGCRTILIDNGNETKWTHGALRMPHHVVPDFRAAARTICRVRMECEA